MSHCPIFILSCGGRTGSTFLSRLLSSTHEIIFWNETDLFNVFDRYASANRWTPRVDIGLKSDLHRFREKSTEMWTAHLRPFEYDLEVGWITMMSEIFSKAAEREGRSRWGIKEISWNMMTVDMIRRMMGSYKIIFLTRRVSTVYRSALGSNWLNGSAGRHNFLANYVRMSAHAISLAKRSCEILARYEDIVQDHRPILDWCGLTRISHQPSKIGSSPGLITKQDWHILDFYLPEINRIHEFLGYEPVDQSILTAEEIANFRD